MHKFLLKSSLKKTPIRIIYESKNGTFSKRTILVKKLNNTHIFAFDLEKQEYRTFIKEQILAVEPIRKNQRTSSA